MSNKPPKSPMLDQKQHPLGDASRNASNIKSAASKYAGRPAVLTSYELMSNQN